MSTFITTVRGLSSFLSPHPFFLPYSPSSLRHFLPTQTTICCKKYPQNFWNHWVNQHIMHISMCNKPNSLESKKNTETLDVSFIYDCSKYARKFEVSIKYVVPNFYMTIKECRVRSWFISRVFNITHATHRSRWHIISRGIVFVWGMLPSRSSCKTIASLKLLCTNRTGLYMGSLMSYLQC